MVAHELGERIGLVPILRAGSGMVDAMLELMPTAQVWHLGLFRDERTLRPVEYYNKLPDSATVDLCLILDPMLATGGSATAAIEVLKKWGAGPDQAGQPDRGARGRRGRRDGAPGRRDLLRGARPRAQREGLHPAGLGDAGDRQFGTGRRLTAVAASAPAETRFRDTTSPARLIQNPT